jgi:hypothetical protein
METPRPGTPGTGTAYAQQTAPPRAPTSPTENASQAADQAKETVQQVAGQVQETGKQVVEQVQEQAFSKVSEQLGRVTETIGSVVEATRSVSDQLRQSDQAMVATYVDQAAMQMEKLAGYLEHKDLPELVGDVDRFARRQPALFMGGAFVLGLMAARFLKSSGYHGSSHRYEPRDHDYGAPGYYNPYASSYAAGYVPRGAPQPPPYGGTANPPPMGGNTMPSSRGGNVPPTSYEASPRSTSRPTSPQPPPYEPTV